MRSLHLLASGLVLASPAAAATLVVDDDGGPGVVFTDIQSALDAAASGDVVLVLPGTYEGYTLTKGVTILGATDPPVVTTTAEIRDVPAGAVAVISNVEHTGWTKVDACDGTVLLDRVRLDELFALEVTACADVRAHDVFVRGGTLIIGSRFEATRGTFRGFTGGDSVCWPATAGQTPLTAGAGALVHLSLCELQGGSGGDVGCAFYYGGDGGDGLWVEAGGQVLVTGDGETIIAGGKAGWGDDCPFDGEQGNAVEVAAGGAFAYADTAFLPGSDPGCGTSGVPILDLGGVVTALGTDVATLESSGATPAGSTCIFTVRGVPGAPALLGFGTAPALAPFPGSPVGILTSLDLGLLSGAIPGSGQLDVAVPVPPSIQVGALAVAQAAVLSPLGQAQLTSSVSLIVTP